MFEQSVNGEGILLMIVIGVLACSYCLSPSALLADEVSNALAVWA